MVTASLSPVAGFGETHLPMRQAELRAHAETRSTEIARNPRVQFVWLTGSVAKGLVDAASDLDLHVVVTGPPLELPAWRFGTALENIHQVSLDELLAGMSARAGAEQANWMARTCLADVLHGAVCLYARQDARGLLAPLEALIVRRNTPRYHFEVARCFGTAARAIAGKAEQMLLAGAPLDAHQLLRRAAQELLVSRLMARGWILRGTKKRPEIADAYGLAIDDPEFMALFHVINGLGELDLETARQLCDARHMFRLQFAGHLRALADVANGPGSAHAVLAGYNDHNLHAANYYMPLLDAGLFRGPVNHVRAFSGFGGMPALALAAAGREARFPVGTWLGDPAADCDVKAEWRRIADLCSTAPLVAELIAETKRMAEAGPTKGARV